MKWDKIFREHIAPYIPIEGLIALEQGLETNDPDIITGITCTPPAEDGYDNPLEPDNCCPLAYALWKGYGLTTNVEIENQFFKLADKVHRPELFEKFINWVDLAPFNEMRIMLLQEVSSIIEMRLKTEVGVAA